MKSKFPFAEIKNTLMIIASISGVITFTNILSQDAGSFKYALNSSVQAAERAGKVEAAAYRGVNGLTINARKNTTFGSTDLKYAQAGIACQQQGWTERILNCDGTINWEEYKNVANNSDQPWALDYRFGPDWSYFHPNDPGNFPTVWGRTGELPPGVMLNGDGSEHRQDYQWQSGWFAYKYNNNGIKPPKGDWFAYSGALLYAPDSLTDSGIARARSFSAYVEDLPGERECNYTHAYDLKLSWTADANNYYNSNTDPSVTQPSWVAASGGVIPRVPLAVARGQFMHSSVMGIEIFKNGLIGATSTGNANDRYPFIKLPKGKVPTGVTVTQQNEFALVTVWDTINRKGQVAVIAIKGRMNGGVYPDANYWGLPYWPETWGLKIIGYVDLPFAAPTSISAVTDVSKEFSGRAYPSDETLDSQSTRDKYWTSADERHTVGSAGWAVVASRAENKVAFIDLERLYKYYRKMYFTTQENFDKTKYEGPNPNQWPYTFYYALEQKPKVTKVITVNQPTAVLAGYPYAAEHRTPEPVHPDPFKGKAWVTSMDGQLLIYDVGGLAEVGPATQVSLVKTVAIGKNPTDINAGRGAEYTNVFITARGDRAVYKLDFQGNLVAVLRDSHLIDPVAASASSGRGPHILSVMDFKGKQVNTYLHQPLDISACYGVGGLGPDGKSEFEWTHSQPVPGMPFLYSPAEVI